MHATEGAVEVRRAWRGLEDTVTDERVGVFTPDGHTHTHELRSCGRHSGEARDRLWRSGSRPGEGGFVSTCVRAGGDCTSLARDSDLDEKMAQVSATQILKREKTQTHPNCVALHRFRARAASPRSTERPILKSKSNSLLAASAGHNVEHARVGGPVAERGVGGAVARHHGGARRARRVRLEVLHEALVPDKVAVQQPARRAAGVPPPEAGPARHVRADLPVPAAGQVAEEGAEAYRRAPRRSGEGLPAAQPFCGTGGRGPVELTLIHE